MTTEGENRLKQRIHVFFADLQTIFTESSYSLNKVGVIMPPAWDAGGGPAG